MCNFYVFLALFCSWEDEFRQSQSNSMLVSDIMKRRYLLDLSMTGMPSLFNFFTQLSYNFVK